MRDFFISSYEKLVGLIIVLMGIGVILAALAASFGGSGEGPESVGGPFAGLFVLIFGAVYLVLFGGFLYLSLGIYQNTKRTAEAVEKLLMK